MDQEWILKTILDLGLSGVLIVGIVMFLKGKIWPESMVEKALASQQESAEKTAEIISQKICVELSDGVKKGMAEGIAEGYFKINGRNT